MSKKQIQINGKVDDGKPTMLDQLFNNHDDNAKYGTTSEDVYETQLNEMTRSDLEIHARKLRIGLVPETDRLRRNLLNEFRGYVAGLNRPNINLAKTQKPSDQLKKILAEGR